MTLHARGQKTSGGCRCPTSITTTIPTTWQMRNHAYKQSKALYEAVGAKKVYNVAALSVDS